MMQELAVAPEQKEKESILPFAARMSLLRER
jgi:hypothetical protein